jgi:hypothetical protein
LGRNALRPIGSASADLVQPEIGPLDLLEMS